MQRDAGLTAFDQPRRPVEENPKELGSGWTAGDGSIHSRNLSRLASRNRTPTPPPLSSMNSTPAASRVWRTTIKVARRADSRLLPTGGWSRPHLGFPCEILLTPVEQASGPLHWAGGDVGSLEAISRPETGRWRYARSGFFMSYRFFLGELAVLLRTISGAAGDLDSVAASAERAAAAPVKRTPG